MLPELNRIRKGSTHISVFRGLNRTVNTGFGAVSSRNSAYYMELRRTVNLSSDDYPQLSARKPRSRAGADGIISNPFFVNGKLLYITDSGRVWYDGVETALPGVDVTKQHDIVGYGNNAVILPEKVLFNLSSKTFEPMDVTITSAATEVYGLNTAAKIAPVIAGNDDPEQIGNLYCGRFGIEKVELDENGVPRDVYCKIALGTSLDDRSNQTPKKNENDSPYPSWINLLTDKLSNDYTTLVDRRYSKVTKGMTIEAMGESPSGLYRCVGVTNERATNTARYRTFIKIDNTYVRITRRVQAGTATISGIKAGDWVKLSGMTASVQTFEGVQDSWGDYVSVLNNKLFKVYYADSESIVIKADIEKSVPYTGAITITRAMPEIDSGMMIEVNNRLWACSSGANEIYACKQGDATNWRAYGDAAVTDSFAATIGHEGDFTGITRQGDSVIFFKENCLIKLFGTKPSNYTLSTINAPGVEKGSEKSVVWINGSVYYLSAKGVCQYSPGGMPVVISDAAFGDRKYRNGVAGRHGSKYFISVQNDENEWELFVCDTAKGLWYREDTTRMLSTSTYNGILYFVDEQGDCIVCADRDHNLLENITDFEQEGEVEWELETGDLYDNEFNVKYISKLKIGASMEQGAEFDVFVRYTQNGGWYRTSTVRYDEKKPRIRPILVRRADHLDIKIVGSGAVNIYGIEIEYGIGSERYGSV